jgi:DNA-binding LacI/PurR family transcriptional regulator
MTPQRPVEFSPTDSQVEAFQQALQEHGLPFLPQLLRHGYQLAAGERQTVRQSHQEQGFHFAQEVFSGPRKWRPDGVVIADDMMTHGALIALDKLKVRAGTDLKIATHANRGSMVLLGREDDLTLIEIDPAEIVQAMFDMLETLMAGRKPRRTNVCIEPHVAG